MKIVYSNEQHKGSRKEQQDSFGFSDIEESQFVSHGGFLSVVADGMGGMKHGGEASVVAINAFFSAYGDKIPSESIPMALQRSLHHANEAVLSLANKTGQEGNVGTTLVASVIHDNFMYWISVGDSRMYIYHDNNLSLLTTDHVYANELNNLAELGEITREEAETHKQRGALTSFLGIEVLKEVDQNIKPYSLSEGDRLILCSDGLYNGISDTEIAHVLGSAKSNEICRSLLNLVLEKSYLNRITLQLCHYHVRELENHY